LLVSSGVLDERLTRQLTTASRGRQRMVEEFDRAKNDKQALAELYERRPALRFAIERVSRAINRPVPIS
jgi:hypothetical protein